MDDQALFQEVLLDHFKRPRRPGRLLDAEAAREGVNPACGDRVALTVKFDGPRVAALRAEGRGCVVSQASASLMAEALEGRPLAEARAWAEKIRAGLARPAAVWPEEFEAAAPLRGLRRQPARAACAALAWTLFLEATGERT